MRRLPFAPPRAPSRPLAPPRAPSGGTWGDASPQTPAIHAACEQTGLDTRQCTDPAPPAPPAPPRAPAPLRPCAPAPLRPWLTGLPDPNRGSEVGARLRGNPGRGLPPDPRHPRRGRVNKLDRPTMHRPCTHPSPAGFVVRGLALKDYGAEQEPNGRARRRWGAETTRASSPHRPFKVRSLPPSFRVRSTAFTITKKVTPDASWRAFCYGFAAKQRGGALLGRRIVFVSLRN